jgi:hypothetical protein
MNNGGSPGLEQSDTPIFHFIKRKKVRTFLHLPYHNRLYDRNLRYHSGTELKCIDIRREFLLQCVEFSIQSL